MNFAEGEPRLYYAGPGVLMALHLFLQRDPVFTGCLWRGIRHCIDMGEQSSRKVRVRVFIVDDSKVEVERPADLLKEVPGTKLVGQAHDVPQAVHGIQKMKPDALILDLMPGGSGLDIPRAIPADYRILMFSLHELSLSPVS